VARGRGRRGNGEGTVWKVSGEGRKPSWRAERQITLKDGTRRRVSARGATQREALDRLRANVRRAMLATPDAARFTVEARFEQWLEQKSYEVRASTIANYRAPLERHLYPALGKRRFVDVTTAEYADFLNGLRASGIATTAEHLRRSLKQMYSHAVRDGLIDASPVAHIGPIRKPAVERGFWTPHEVKLFLDASQTTRYRELFIIALFAGLRRGELLALRWEDLGPDDAYINVKRTYNPYEPGRVGPPKTAHSLRRVPLGHFARDAIAESRARYLSERRQPTYADEGWVFASSVGTMPGDRNVFSAFANTILKAQETQAKLDEQQERRRTEKQTDEAEKTPRMIRFHDMRRIYASYLAQSGYGPGMIQHLLGHATPDLALKVYTTVHDSQVERAALELEDIMPEGTIPKPLA